MKKPLILLAALLVSLSASADLYSPPSPNAVPTSGASWGQQQGYCNNICSALVNGKGQVLGLNGGVGWSVADDLWCANHGSQTNPLVTASPVPGGAAPPGGSCPVTLIPGDTNCNQAVSMVAHCGWHNGQLEQQCEAYEAAGGSNSGEKVVLAIDIAATAVCGTACAMNAATAGTMEAACRDAGLAASTTELIQTLMQKSTPMAKAMNLLPGGIGLYMTMKPMINPADGAKPMDAKTFFGGNSNATDKPSSRMKNGACMSAVMFAAMTGLRYMNMQNDDSTQQNACNQVQQLASNAPTIGSGGMPLQSTLGSGSTGVASTGGGATGATNSGDSSLRCVSSGGSVSSCTGVSAAAPDVAALQNTGLGQQLAPQAAQVAESPLSSAGAGSAVRSAMNAAGAPNNDITGAISTVAAEAQEQSHELFDKIGSMGGSGGGGGDDSGSPQPNPMAMLAAMLGKHGAQGGPGNGTQVFKGAQDRDIWHTNSPDNLFQIVSGRIQKVTSSLTQ